MAVLATPDTILRELSALWVSLGKQGDDERGSGVLRACSMTLVVLAESSEDVMGLGETVAALMPEHPARAIIVRLQPSGEAPLEARVYSQCWMPFKQRRQICCEQIEITAADRSIGDLPPLILPLAAPDLPVIVWSRCPRIVRMPEFGNIARIATKVVIDSGQFSDPKEALSRLAALSGGLLAGDLAWTRLTRWREMLAQVFENRSYLDLLPGVSAVRIVYGRGQETSARYMAAWLVNRLRSVEARPRVELMPADDFQVRLAGPKLQVEQMCHEGRLTIALNGGLSQCTHLSEPTDYLLMREELGILHRDAVFEVALKAAVEL